MHPRAPFCVIAVPHSNMHAINHSNIRAIARWHGPCYGPGSDVGTVLAILLKKAGDFLAVFYRVKRKYTPFSVYLVLHIARRIPKNKNGPLQIACLALRGGQLRAKYGKVLRALPGNVTNS